MAAGASQVRRRACWGACGRRQALPWVQLPTIRQNGAGRGVAAGAERVLVLRARCRREYPPGTRLARLACSGRPPAACPLSSSPTATPPSSTTSSPAPRCWTACVRWVAPAVAAARPAAAWPAGWLCWYARSTCCGCGCKARRPEPAPLAPRCLLPGPLPMLCLRSASMPPCCLLLWKSLLRCWLFLPPVARSPGVALPHPAVSR